MVVRLSGLTLIAELMSFAHQGYAGQGYPSELTKLV